MPVAGGSAKCMQSMCVIKLRSKCPTWDEPVRRYSDIKPCMSSWKDILIPGHTDHARLQAMRMQNRPTDERDILMTFHGSHSGNKDLLKIACVKGL